MSQDFLLVARLFNGKRAVVEPNYKTGVCHYRYLSKDEMANETLYPKRKYKWYKTTIQSTVEGNEQLVFANVDATPIVIQRTVLPTKALI